MGNEISRTCGFETPSADTLALPGKNDIPSLTISSYPDISTSEEKPKSTDNDHHQYQPNEFKKHVSSPPRQRPHMRSPLKKKPPTSPLKDSIIRKLSARVDEFESDSDASFSVPALLPVPSPLALLEESHNSSMIALDDSSCDEQREHDRHYSTRNKPDFTLLLQLIEWENYYPPIDTLEEGDGKKKKRKRSLYSKVSHSLAEFLGISDDEKPPKEVEEEIIAPAQITLQNLRAYRAWRHRQDTVIQKIQFQRVKELLSANLKEEDQRWNKVIRVVYPPSFDGRIKTCLFLSPHTIRSSDALITHELFSKMTRVAVPHYLDVQTKIASGPVNHIIYFWNPPFSSEYCRNKTGLGCPENRRKQRWVAYNNSTGTSIDVFGESTPLTKEERKDMGFIYPLKLKELCIRSYLNSVVAEMRKDSADYVETIKSKDFRAKQKHDFTKYLKSSTPLPQELLNLLSKRLKEALDSEIASRRKITRKFVDQAQQQLGITLFQYYDEDCISNVIIRLRDEELKRFLEWRNSIEDSILDKQLNYSVLGYGQPEDNQDRPPLGLSSYQIDNVKNCMRPLFLPPYCCSTTSPAFLPLPKLLRQPHPLFGNSIDLEINNSAARNVETNPNYDVCVVMISVSPVVTGNNSRPTITAKIYHRATGDVFELSDDSIVQCVEEENFV
eukprot:TRINITY_DN4039_c0_g1_i3.p1 TRINITY_DN4039_c0_g1~~TRINITY_DN4039_c0_g1_i3.p1  ORF type:complete len:670 (+),score=142.53 TRINITY_DN4039_c0_g1_i3:257-2266(+)